MSNQKIAAVLIAALSTPFLTGFGLGDVTKAIKPDTEKCDKKSDKKSCERKEQLKSAAKVAAIGIAAKLIYDMVVDYKTKPAKSEEEVIAEYLKSQSQLPEEPTLTAYKATIAPSNVAHVGKPVVVKTWFTVVPSRKSRQALIEEKIEIHDNEDNSKVIKSLTKSVNKDTKAAGAYENQFSFVLPVGMPEGIYPISTSVIVDGKEESEKLNKMQLALRVLKNRTYQIAYMP